MAVHGAGPVTSPERGRWAGTIRDVLTIVGGVLIALAANAWWEGHRDRGREHDYMRQLTADLTLTESRLDSALKAEKHTVSSTRAMMDLLPSATQTEVDTLGKLMKSVLNYADPRLVMGTITALQQTGDLNLIRDDSVRNGVSAYATSVAADWADFTRFVDLSLQSGLIEAVIRSSHSNGVPTKLVPLLIEAKEDREIRISLGKLASSAGNRVNYLTQIRNNTHHLLELTRKAAEGK